MKTSELKTLKNGDSLFVSYKGIRPCKFKNLKGSCAFVEFDDGTGYRLRRVLANTLIAKNDPRVKVELKKASTLPPDIQEAVNKLNEISAYLSKMGYEVELK